MKKKGERILIVFFLFIMGWATVLGQQTRPPGIDSVVIFFAQPPQSVSVQKAALKYNKDFALSFQMDDAISDIYNKIFPVFHGDGVSPGLTFTDGCGNPVTFKMSSGLYIFSSYNKSDILNPDDPYHDRSKLTWPQLDTLFRAHWGIENHGLFDDPNAGSPDIITYAFQRTESYARKKLSDSIAVRSFIIPNGLEVYVNDLRENHYDAAINQGKDASWIGFGDIGINVESDTIDWLKPVKLNRLFLYGDFKKLADSLYAQSRRGIHKWALSGMHTIPGSFLSEMREIENVYGAPGKDDVLFAPDDEILDYLAVKQAVRVKQTLRGTKLTLTFTGHVPTDRIYYAMTLNVGANQKIEKIAVYGTDRYGFAGLGKDTALINLSWDGRIYPSKEMLADSFTSLALATGSQYKALVAMDYVEQLPQGETKIRLQDSLCMLDRTGWMTGYDPGFCNLVDLGADTSLCPGDSLVLTGPENMASYAWYHNRHLFSTRPSVTVFPDTASDYALVVTDKSGNQMSDTVHVTVFPVPGVWLGNDTALCAGSCLSLAVPEGNYHYRWSTGDTLSFTQVCPVSDTLVSVIVETSDGCLVGDSVEIVYRLPPDIHIAADRSAFCFGDSVRLSVQSADTGLSYRWSTGDTTAFVHLLPEHPDTTLLVSVKALSPAGCVAADTASVVVLPKIPPFSLGPDTALCAGSCLLLSAPDGNFSSLWSTGDTATSLTVCPVSDTTVSLTVYTPEKCSASDSVFIEYQPLPGIAIRQESAAYCFGDTVTLQVVSPDTGLSYLWNTGDTVSVMKTRPAVADTGFLFSVRATSKRGCISRDSARIFVRPQVSLKMDTTVFKTCNGRPVTLACSPVQGSFARFNWFFDGNDYETEADSLVLYQPAISGWVTVTGIDGFGCKAVDSAFLKTMEYPDLVIPGDTGVCPGDSLVLTGSGGSFFYWLNGSDTVSTNRELHLLPQKQATYLAVTGFDPMCMRRDSLAVVVFSLPKPRIVKGNKAVCMNTPLTLYATGAAQYLWQPGAVSADSFFLKPTDTVTVYLTGISDKGCLSRDSLVLSPARLPTPHFSGLMPSYCENDPVVSLTGVPAGGLFLGAGIRDSLFSPADAGPGNHTVVYRYISREGCAGNSEKQVYVYGPVPAIHLMPADTTLHPGGYVQYDAGPGFDAYYWSTGDMTQKVRVRYGELSPGKDTVHVVAITGGCSSAGSAVVTFEGVSGTVKTRVEPLALYPNPARRTVFVTLPDKGMPLVLEVFDRLGKKVLHRQFSACPGKCVLKLDVSSLKPGVYFVWVENGASSYFSKMIVQ